MSVAGTVGAAAQVVLVAAGSPLLVGVMRQVRARLEGRAGAGVLQPWRDLRKLLRKEAITPDGTGPVFRAAPLVLTATALVAAGVVPIATTASPLDGAADLFAVTALLALGTVALLIKQEILFVVVGGVFVMEAASVIIQVGSFKLTGRRVFRMAPIHHHFELIGWSEPKVITRFVIIAIIFALFSLTTLKLR